MMTAIVIGRGSTSWSTSANGTAMLLLARTAQTNGGITIAASIALLVNAIAHLGERQDLDLDVVDGQPDALQDLADLVGGDRARAVAGDHLALELLDVGDLRP